MNVLVTNATVTGSSVRFMMSTTTAAPIDAIACALAIDVSMTVSPTQVRRTAVPVEDVGKDGGRRARGAGCVGRERKYSGVTVLVAGNASKGGALRSRRQQRR